jgi:hypothetical protein
MIYTKGKGNRMDQETLELDRLLLQMLSHFSEEDRAAFAEALDNLDGAAR